MRIINTHCMSCAGPLCSEQEKNRGECRECKRKRLAAAAVAHITPVALGLDAAAAPLSAPQPEPSSHPDRPNYCCENGDFGDNHECRKQPGPLGGPTIEEPVYPDDCKSKNVSRFKAEVASSPSPTSGQSTKGDSALQRNGTVYDDRTLIQLLRCQIAQSDAAFELMRKRAYDAGVDTGLDQRELMEMTKLKMGAQNEYHGCPELVKSEFGEWVKVTPETMPERGVRVLVYLGRGRIDVDHIDKHDGFWEEWSPTHWMPLPSPPQEPR